MVPLPTSTRSTVRSRGWGRGRSPGSSLEGAVYLRSAHSKSTQAYPVASRAGLEQSAGINNSGGGFLDNLPQQTEIRHFVVISEAR